MCSCSCCTGKLEVLSVLMKFLDIAKSSIQDTGLATRFNKIKTKMEGLQFQTVKEILYREDKAMEQLRLVVHHIDGMMKAGQDAVYSASLVVNNLDQIDASIDKALAAASIDQRAKRSKKSVTKEGPWGSRIGTEWDIGPFGKIKTIYVSADDRINSLRFEYEVDDQVYRTPRIGGEGGTLHQIGLDDDELIKFVRGVHSTDGLTKLEIITTKQIHSFGKGLGETIVFPSALKFDCNYKVVGFFGWESPFVNSIGLYMEKCPNCPPDSSPYPRP